MNPWVIDIMYFFGKSLSHVTSLLQFRMVLASDTKNFTSDKGKSLMSDILSYVSRSSQYTTTGVTKAVVYTILSVGWCI